jgi:hypothetical protein
MATAGVATHRPSSARHRAARFVSFLISVAAATKARRQVHSGNSCMSTSDTNDSPIVKKDWMERASDLVNPLLVKETRQSLKSRGFVSVFLLMLIASWLISAGGTLYVYGPELPYAAAGRYFFWLYYIVLAFAVFLVIPQGAFRSIQSERDLQTFDMLIITSLSPRKIVWGKWWSAVVQTMVYYAAIAPFMMFTNLLRGISLVMIVFILAWSFIASICLSMLAISCSTFTKQRQAFGLIQFLLVGPLIGVLVGVVNLSREVLNSELPIERYEFWIAHVVVLSFVIPLFVVLRQIATANLTFEGANRSTGIRGSCLVLLIIALCWMTIATLSPTFFSVTLPPLPFDVAFVWMCMLHVFLWLVGLFAVTEDERLSRRVREEVPDNAFLRLCTLLFFPGGGRGFLYLLVSLAAVDIVFWKIMPNPTTFGLFSTATDPLAQARTLIVVLTSYLLFYLGLTAFLGRALRRLGTDLHAAHARVLGVLIVAFGTIAPLLFLFFVDSLLDNSWMLLSNPFVTIFFFMQKPDDAPIWRLASLSIPVPLFLGFLGVILNISSIANGIREFFTLPARAPFVEELE